MIALWTLQLQEIFPGMPVSLIEERLKQHGSIGPPHHLNRSQDDGSSTSSTIHDRSQTNMLPVATTNQQQQRHDKKDKGKEKSSTPTTTDLMQEGTERQYDGKDGEVKEMSSLMVDSPKRRKTTTFGGMDDRSPYSEDLHMSLGRSQTWEPKTAEEEVFIL